MVNKTYRRKRRTFTRTRRAVRKRTMYKRRSTYTRKKKFYSQRVQTQFMPLSKIVKMRYVETISITLTSAGTNYGWYFKPNSIYDPNGSGGGHQPTNRDLWMTYFNDYLVIGSRITVKPIRDTNLQSEIWYNVWLCEDISDLPNTSTELAEFKGKPGIMGSWIDDNRRVKRAYYSANKWFKRKVMTDADMWTSVNNDPNNALYFYIQATCPAAGSQTAMFAVTIDYTVAVRHRKDNNTQN